MHTTNHSLSEIHDESVYNNFLASLFTHFNEGNRCVIGHWIELSAHELHQQIKNKCHSYPNETQQEIRAHFIQLIINKINHNSYGSGMVYELYEERKQDAIRGLLECIPFSEDEVIFIKNECDYMEDMTPYLELCDCGTAINALQVAQSLSMSGNSCCANCLGN